MWRLVVIFILCIVIIVLARRQSSYSGDGYTLNAGDTLKIGETIKSRDFSPYTAKIQENGEFVVVGPRGIVQWSSNTATDLSTAKSYYLTVDNTGNLILYTGVTPPGSWTMKAAWSSGTSNKGKAPHRLEVGSGNLILYDSKNTVIWSSGAGKKF
jgi:hypothetical protein